MADPAFRPAIEKPTHAADADPVVLVDEGHFNAHTSSGRDSAFADLLRRDGDIVRPSAGPFRSDAWRAGKALVVANALHEENDRNSRKPPFRPAFAPEEVDAVRNWAAGGGRLLLIADPAPFDAAAENLAGRAPSASAFASRPPLAPMRPGPPLQEVGRDAARTSAAATSIKSPRSAAAGSSRDSRDRR